MGDGLTARSSSNGERPLATARGLVGAGVGLRPLPRWSQVGMFDGCRVGSIVGSLVGICVGSIVGPAVGRLVGAQTPGAVHAVLGWAQVAPPNPASHSQWPSSAPSLTHLRARSRGILGLKW